MFPKPNAGKQLEQLSVEAALEADWSLSFTRKVCRAAYQYWATLSGDRPMPRRSELRPDHMRTFLSHVNLVDIISTGPDGGLDYRVSLQGLHSQAVFGSLVQRPLDECLGPRTVARGRYCFGLPALSGRPVRINAQITAHGRDWLRSETLLAPLGDADAGTSGLFWIFDSWTEERPAGQPLSA